MDLITLLPTYTASYIVLYTNVCYSPVSTIYSSGIPVAVMKMLLRSGTQPAAAAGGPAGPGGPAIPIGPGGPTMPAGPGGPTAKT